MTVWLGLSAPPAADRLIRVQPSRWSQGVPPRSGPRLRRALWPQ